MANSGYGPVTGDAVGPGTYWEDDAGSYYAEHGEFLGDSALRWCPEGLTEDTAHLLGDVAGLDVMEVGCGSGQGTRWAGAQGARALGVDLSFGMLSQLGGAALIQGDARSLPLTSGAFDLAFSAFGALPFVPDLGQVHREVARVLRPGGRWVFATTHPIAWVFPDSGRPEDLTVEQSYFDTSPYWETDDDGRLTYAEYHHTIADHVAALVGAGFTIDTLLEPEWTAGSGSWGGSWSQERAALVPGTLIIGATLR
jgi:SAM-dependent methyltransferase